MKKVLLSLALLLALSLPTNAQTLAPLDVPASVLVNETASFVVTVDQVPSTFVVDATAGNLVATLPDATAVPAGKGVVLMLSVAASHNLSVATFNSQTVNGLSASSFNSASKLTVAATSLKLVSNGANWVASSGAL